MLERVLAEEIRELELVVEILGPVRVLVRAEEIRELELETVLE